ncbi:MAG: hypothetical protein EOO15_12245 [Chitinophagaceae bacterium]|nr:MAG: hypothetical protein EOO15_12245 [Chitinophagaceae bacterium]
MVVALMVSLTACSPQTAHLPTQNAPPLGIFWNQGFVHDEPLGGPWRLIAVDAREDMMICRSVDESEGDCAGDMLGGPTIFAAGIDEKYVVYARHPQKWPAPPDRAVSEYYYVIRSPMEGHPAGLNGGKVQGPFDEVQFGAESKRLGLPPLSRVFEDLR